MQSYQAPKSLLPILTRFGKMLPYNQDSFQGAARSQAVNLEDAIKCSQDFMLSLQYPEGYWWADLESNATITAEMILFIKMMGIESKYPLHKMENFLRRRQCSHGGWEVSYGDGGELSVTIESYMALRLLNVPRSDPALQKAHSFIISKGGITKSRIFTKLYLAFLGLFDWNDLPTLPPWLMFLPSWFLFSIYEMSSWARSCMVPLIVLFEKKPVFKVTPQVSCDELYAEGKKYARTAIPLLGDFSDFFVIVDRLLKTMKRWGLEPLGQRGIKAAEKWVLERQDESGHWGGIYPAKFYSLVCLRVLGYEITDPVMQRGLHAMKEFSIETEDEYSVQSCVSPVWDTALVMRSLVESGIAPDHPALQKGGDWLLQKQITQHGDWSVKNKSGCAGGWAFEFFNRWFPDVDDSAVVVMALDAIRLPNDDAKNGAIARSIKWMSSMQCKAGGWAAFDINNDQNWLNSTPLGDLKALIDPNTADVTARVLEMVGRLKLRDVDNIVEAAFPPLESINKGLEYLRKEQEKEGCWYGRWGVNYIYGTSGVLVALSLIAPSTHAHEIARGARWLVEVQNMQDESSEEYGGWGETCYTYNDPALKGQGDVTPSQTAWALMGLLAAGDALGKYEVDSIERGVRYLLSSQRKDGSWHEAHFTGTGFPRSFYLRYHYYAQHFTLTALARYRSRKHKLSSSYQYQSSGIST